jgi:hypothetical protein
MKATTSPFGLCAETVSAMHVYCICTVEAIGATVVIFEAASIHISFVVHIHSPARNWLPDKFLNVGSVL